MSNDAYAIDDLYEPITARGVLNGFRGFVFFIVRFLAFGVVLLGIGAMFLGRLLLALVAAFTVIPAVSLFNLARPKVRAQH